MEKENYEDDTMNSTGLSLDDDIFMDTLEQYESTSRPTKRRKLIEQFEAL